MKSLTINQKTNYIGFPKAAELIEITGAHQLEASDRALQNMLLQVAHDSGRITEPDAEWELTFAAARAALSKHESNDRVRASLDRLMSVQVTVHYKTKTGEPRTQKTHLLEFIDTGDGDDGNATIQFGIPKKLRLLLARSNRWGRVRCEVSYAMTSKYAIALYELLCLRANMQQCAESFPIEHFRELLGVPPGTYAQGQDFRRKVIEPAVLEVNGLSDIGVKIELRRRHACAPIDRVDMAWWRQQGDEYRASMEERQRHKAGRKARLWNKVETIAVDEAG
jgi:Initiator Replication protein